MNFVPCAATHIYLLAPPHPTNQRGIFSSRRYHLNKLCPLLGQHVNRLPLPIDVLSLESLLQLSNYDTILLAKLHYGFRYGFNIMHKKMPSSCLAVKNHNSALQHFSVMDSFLRKELSLDRIAGQILEPSFSSFQLSPLGLVPKKSAFFSYDFFI